MERWRWMPRNLGNEYVLVNIPDFTMQVIQHDRVVWQTKVIVGSPAKPTPLLSADLDEIVVNPTWVVPPTIVNDKYLPALRIDSTVLDRMGLKWAMRGRDRIIFEAPGPTNPMGRLAFLFPNKLSAVQIDTPDKYLFSREVRDYSSCDIRVQEPAKYADVLLSLTNPADGYTEERIKAMFGSHGIDIKLKRGIPIHLTYQTAFIDSVGKLVMRRDIYNYDALIIRNIAGDQRSLSRMNLERKEPMPNWCGEATMEEFSGSAQSDGDFGWLFGGQTNDKSR
jgi:murein L,D-transpeptidase YcbB/YkuD